MTPDQEETEIASILVEAMRLMAKNHAKPGDEKAFIVAVFWAALEMACEGMSRDAIQRMLERA